MSVEYAMSEQARNKRLKRLVKSGICSGEDFAKYSAELKQLAAKLANTETAEKHAKFFRALADENRQKILRLLEAREMCVCEIMVALELTQPTASHHLRILENAGLVKDRKEGKWVFYTVANPKLVRRMLEQKI